MPESKQVKWYKKHYNLPSPIITIGGGFILLCIFMIFFGESMGLKTSEPPPMVKAPLSRTEQIESAFSPWDGSHRNLTEYIKKSMNDPSSYEHVETAYWDLKDHLVVLTTFRGKNALGATVTNSVKAEVDLDGNVAKIIENFTN